MLAKIITPYRGVASNPHLHTHFSRVFSQQGKPFQVKCNYSILLNKSPFASKLLEKLALNLLKTWKQIFKHVEYLRFWDLREIFMDIYKKTK